jgi:hypothetical protein
MGSGQNELILALQLRKESGQKGLEIEYGFRIGPFRAPDMIIKN